MPLQARAVCRWGHTCLPGVALRSAARTVAAGLSIAPIDDDMAFQVAPFIAMAQVCRVSPDIFRHRVHLGPAFAGWQFTTRLCDRLTPLLAPHPTGLFMLLEPLTAFFAEEITDQEATLLFLRLLQPLAALPKCGPRLLIAQTVPAVQTPRRVFARDLLRVMDVGLRLTPGSGPWSVELVKPRPPTYPPDHLR